MAYTVGSASVDIVPDFRNAQLAITKFFNDQKDQIRIPVKLDVSQTGTENVERQAAQVGSRVSKAMNAAMERNQRDADKLALQMAEGREKSIQRAHAEAIRVNAQMDREAARQRQDTERLTDQIVTASIKARQQAHAEALRIDAQRDREAARVRAQLERDAARERVQQSRIEEAAAKQRAKAEEDAARLADQIAEGRLRARREAHAEALRLDAQYSRERTRTAREEERLYDDYLKAQIAGLKKLQQEASKQEKIRLQVEIDERQAILDGRRAGGLITRSIHAEMKQNAGLIAAVIGGILVAGAPAAIAGATALFGGIGVVAAAQSEKVRSAWRGTWQDISQGAREDAEVLVPVLVRSADRIGQAFSDLRPILRDSFAASGPQIDTFVGSVIQAAENAVPGLVRAVKEAGPAITGLGNLFERAGSGVGEFFDILSRHAPAAGAAATELGRSLEALLPTIGELLGQGAETATVVLPAVTQAFNGLHGIVDLLGGSIPALLSAFIGFRVLQGTGRLLDNFAAKMGLVSIQGGAFSGIAGKAAGAASKLADVMPGVGAAAGIVAAIMARGEQQATDWAQAILKGGDAAKQARAEMSSFGGALRETNTGFGGVLAGLIGTTATFYTTADAIKDAGGEVDEYLKSLSPLERAQYDVDVATRALEEALSDEGTTARDLAGLKQDVARAAQRQREEEERVEKATRGVTEAMGEQADAALARIDADFAYQKALFEIEESTSKVKVAQDELNEARKKGNANDIALAELALKEVLTDQAESYLDALKAADALAQSKLPAAMDDQQKKILGAKAALDELNRLIASGVPLSPGLQEYKNTLERLSGSADGAMLAQAQLVQSLGEVGAAVTAIPDSAAVKIEAPTEEVKTRLEDLGFTVTEIPGTKDVRVSAVTKEAQDNLGNLSGLLSDIGDQTPTPKVDLDPRAFQLKFIDTMSSIGILGLQVPKPRVDLDPASFQGKFVSTMSSIGILGLQKPTPLVDADPRLFAGKHATAMADIGTLNRQKPTPIMDANPAPFNAVHTLTMQRSAEIHRQRPTPIVDADPRPGQAAIDRFVTSNSGRTINLNVGAVGSAAYMAFRQAEIQSRAQGGIVYGPGTATSDSIPALLSNGEFVINAKSTAENRELLEAINRGYIATFAQGGFVTKVDANTGGAQVSFNQLINALAQSLERRSAAFATATAAKAAAAAAAAAAAGTGTTTGAWGSLWDYVRARVPQARINSTFRPGDPGYHGRGKAIDFGYGTGPGGAGSAGLALINRVLHDGLGANLAELIYTGIGDDRPDLKNGRPLNYGAATNAAHRNHVHAAVRDQGGPFWPGETAYNAGGPEHILDARDVALMGGQEGVLDFRDALKAGMFSGPGPDTSVQQMIASGAIPRSAGASTASPRSVSLYTPDVPSAVRALKAVEHEESVLASVW